MSNKNETEELLTKEFEFETTIDISIYDILHQFNDAQKRALVKELIDEVTIEDEDDLIYHEPSLGDVYKMNHFKKVYSPLHNNSNYR
jgi:hypothetical protein